MGELFDDQRDRYPGKHLLTPAGYERWRLNHDQEEWPPRPGAVAIVLSCTGLCSAVATVVAVVVRAGLWPF